MADQVIKETFTLTLTYEMSVNTDTGEILETRLVDRSVNKPKATKPAPKKELEDDGAAPELTLEGNKYHLNAAAVSLMEISADDKIDIKYENGKNGSVPVIGTDEAFGTKGGNKLTKSNTVACRGSKNEELSKYGSKFTLVPHPSKPGLFVLTSETVKADQLVGDDNVSVDEEEAEDLPFDLSLDDLANGEDANISEVDSSFFKL